MTDITLTMIDEADDATLLRYQRELSAEAERVTNARKAELGQAFTDATRYIAQQADGNGHRQGYIDEAEEARDYMPEWLRPWLPDPEVRVDGMYVYYTEALIPKRDGRDVTSANYQPSFTNGHMDGQAIYVGNYGTLRDYMKSRMPEDLWEQVSRYVHVAEPSARQDYRLS